MKKILIAAIAVIAIFLLSSCSNNNNGVTVVNINGVNISTFESKDEAYLNTISQKAEIMSIKVNTNEWTSVHSNAGVTGSGQDYTIDLAGCEGQTVLVQFDVGGDGTLTNRLLTDDVKNYYLAFEVNSTQTSNTPTPATPSGTVKFGDVAFKTYGSEAAAQAAIANQAGDFTIPESMISCTLSAEPRNDTARIWVSVEKIDGVSIDGKKYRLNADSSWATEIDFSEFCGHQVTLMLHFEDSKAFHQAFEYVSFFVPAVSEAPIVSKSDKATESKDQTDAKEQSDQVSAETKNDSEVEPAGTKDQVGVEDQEIQSDQNSTETQNDPKSDQDGTKDQAGVEDQETQADQNSTETQNDPKSDQGGTKDQAGVEDSSKSQETQADQNSTADQAT